MVSGGGGGIFCYFKNLFLSPKIFFLSLLKYLKKKKADTTFNKNVPSVLLLV